MIGIDPEAPFGLEFARMANHILRVLELVASENGDYVGLRLDAAGGAELAKPCQSGTGSRLGADAIPSESAFGIEDLGIRDGLDQTARPDERPPPAPPPCAEPC